MGINRFLPLAFLFLFYGCLTLGEPNTMGDDANTFLYNVSGTNASVGRDNCTVMLCNSDKSLIATWFYELFGADNWETNLYGGVCRFEHKTPVEIEEMIGNFASDPTRLMDPSASSGDDYIRPFMFGQGSTFAEFDEANAYCDNNLSMAVKWLEWDPTDPNTPPYVALSGWEAELQRTRAKCYLDVNTIPVYIFYTNSTLPAMQVDNIRRFARNFEDSGDEAGPIVISPEFSYNITKGDGLDGARIQRIKDMVKAIRGECTKCMIMLAPPEENMAALDAIMQDGEIRGMVNIIGQGWTINLDENCSFYHSIYDKMNFSRSVLAKYQKPTLWAYLAAGNSSNTANTCNWTAKMVADAFDTIYLATPGLVSAGGIGIGHYQLLDSVDIMHTCTENCSYGLLSSSEDQKQPMFNRWFSRCLDYNKVEINSGGHAENLTKVPIVFNYFGDNGSECDVLPKLGPLKMLSFSTAPEPTGADMARLGETYTCDRCFGNVTRIVVGQMELTITYPLTPPSDWYFIATSFFDDLHLALKWHNTDNNPNCDIYRIGVRKWSELSCKWEMDPLFVRAVIDHDSSYDRCKVTYVPLSDGSCNPNNILDLTSSPRGPITDPDTTEPCADTRTDLRVDVASGLCAPGGTGERCKPCTFGLMRCTYPPYQWGAAPFTTPIPPYVGSVPYGCGPNFNPYNIQSGLCCGTNSLCESIEKAVNWAYTEPQRSGLLLTPLSSNWPTVDRDKWTVLLLALSVYHKNNPSQAQVNAMLDGYYAHWQRTKWCPNSANVPNSAQSAGVTETGPAKTFIWNYCNAYNDTGAVFWGANPLQACRDVSIPASCHIACAGHPDAPGRGFWPTPGGQLIDPVTIDISAFDTTDIDADGVSDFAVIKDCLEADECVTPWGGSYVCPDQFFSLDPETYRCNAGGTCCGGSFLEHLCCLDPYACEVLFEYNKTVNTCPTGKFCEREQ